MNINTVLADNIVLILLLLIIILLIIYKKQSVLIVERFKNLYTINDIYLYIFSWKRVNDNAVRLYNKVVQSFPNTYFINCDENFDASAYIPKSHLIERDDSYYFGGQFETGMRHCPEGKIYGNVVGDVDPDYIDWDKLATSLLHAVNNLNAGVFAPDAPNYPSVGKHIEGSYHIVNNTDETIFFITPELYSKYKNFPYNSTTKYGFGIDIFFCGLSEKLGKRTIRDSSIKVNTDKKRGYNTDDAMKQMNVFLEKIGMY
jgi:hypothetical protein